MNVLLYEEIFFLDLNQFLMLFFLKFEKNLCLVKCPNFDLDGKRKNTF